MAHRYLLALGSNMRHVRHGRPRAVITAAIGALQEAGIEVDRVSRILSSAPLGPSRRRYANAAATVRTDLDPQALLSLCQRIERDFGRTRGGRRWGARVLDIDIVLWSGGTFACPNLVIPHPEFRTRRFVLDPAAEIHGPWRDPVTTLTLRHLRERLTRPIPSPSCSHHRESIPGP